MLVHKFWKKKGRGGKKKKKEKKNILTAFTQVTIPTHWTRSLSWRTPSTIPKEAYLYKLKYEWVHEQLQLRMFVAVFFALFESFEEEEEEEKSAWFSKRTRISDPLAHGQTYWVLGRLHSPIWS